VGQGEEPGEEGGVGRSHKRRAGLRRLLCLGLKRLVSYIQRRLFSGNTPALPNQPADIPNRMAVPKTKTQIHPIRSAVNIKASKVSVRPTLLDARLGLIRATPARIAGTASIVRRKGGRVGFARLLQTGSHGAFQ
jgi:hypothetical protein